MRLVGWHLEYIESTSRCCRHKNYHLRKSLDQSSCFHHLYTMISFELAPVSNSQYSHCPQIGLWAETTVAKVAATKAYFMAAVGDAE